MVFGFRRRHEAEQVIYDMPSPDGGEYMVDGTMNTLKQFEKMHHLDPNLPIDELNEIDTVLNAGNAEKGIEIEQVLVEDNSPYPEVRRPSSLRVATRVLLQSPYACS
jgi:hypothetical protein